MTEAMLNGVDRDLRLTQVLDAYLAALQAGTAPEQSVLLAQHPGLAEELRECLASLAFIRQAAQPAEGSGEEPAPKELGDFRILREIGRGGMGVVYEAEQMSLARPVALKVLPLAATMDPRQLQRFHNEAKAAACLHHTNIVPVFGVGRERGIHFYAMQLIEGQTLAELIAELRRGQGDQAPADGEPATTAYAPAPAAAPAAASTVPRAGLTTDGSVKSAAYFRAVARLGVQAAEALDYAHQMGVVHRDIKPGNLMLDGRGDVWVTDFGLAQLLQGDVHLTMTGDLVGTLRYMSPEQALAKRVVIDHRTDVYSLGVTLYELLTLQPAFPGRDRQELLRQVAFDEPQLPRKVNRAIPHELETVVLKAMEKNPAERYATAQELADDLRRFLDGQLIRARRPTLLQRARRLARRHRAVVWATTLVLLVATLCAGGAGLWWLQKRAAAQSEARVELREANRLGQQEKWPEALGSVRRARGALAGVGADSDLQQEVEELGRDLEMARRLQEARLRRAALNKGDFDWESTRAAYAEAFKWYGLDVEDADPAQAGEYIQSRSIRLQLAAALDDWADMPKANRRHLLAISRVADPDPWRNRLRDALERNDHKTLEELAASARGDALPPVTVVLLARGSAAAERVLVILRQAQQRHPDDFWLNLELANAFNDMQPPQLDEAIGFYRVAVALRPGDALTHCNLGVGLARKGRVDEAIAAFREAIRLKKDDPSAHSGLGAALNLKGQLDDAIAEHRQALRLKKDYAEAHHNLGNALQDKGQLDEAIAEYREAIRLKKDYAEAHFNLGVALKDKGLLDKAIDAYREAIRLKKDYADAHNNLGSALYLKGRLDEAIPAWREALRLKKDYPEIHCNLGLALAMKGRLDEAIAAYGEALRLKPDFAPAHNNLAGLLADSTDEKLQDTARAVKHAQRAVQLAPGLGGVWNTLGVAHYRNGDAKAAVAALGKSVELGKGGDANDFFFLAMAHWRLGHKDQARTWYDKAVQWMDSNKPKDEELRRHRVEMAGRAPVTMDVEQPKDDDLRRYRAEAATLLGVKDRPAQGKDPPAPNK